MVEIEMEHVLIFCFIIFALYYLNANKVIDKFSVGGITNCPQDLPSDIVSQFNTCFGKPHCKMEIHDFGNKCIKNQIEHYCSCKKCKK